MTEGNFSSDRAWESRVRAYAITLRLDELKAQCRERRIKRTRAGRWIKDVQGVTGVCDLETTLGLALSTFGKQGAPGESTAPVDELDAMDRSELERLATRHKVVVGAHMTNRSLARRIRLQLDDRQKSSSRA